MIVFGTNISVLRGKTVCIKVEKLYTYYMSIPINFYKLHNFIALVADIIYVNNVMLLVKISPKVSIFIYDNTQ